MMRICVVYDCLFPYTVGGAERWYRNLAEQLAAEGHEVTYLTLRQWASGERVAIDPAVHVVSAGPRMALYSSGRRRILPPLVFGVGVLAHLLRHGRRYDVVHTCSFPYFSLLSAALLRRTHRYRLVVDWHEVWSRRYWREYLGPLGGATGYLVQLACVRLHQQAFCFSQLHARRLVDEGIANPPTVLEGEYSGPTAPPPIRSVEPIVVFAGRLIAEKRVLLAVSAFAAAARRIPGLRGQFYGDGPERELLLAAITQHGLRGALVAPGFVATSEIDAALGSAMCMLSTSRREGYGLIVVEAAGRGTPSIVVEGPDNAAAELVEHGVNGFVAPDDDPRTIAEAIVRVHEQGLELRRSTRRWFVENAQRLSVGSSLRVVLASYSAGEEPGPEPPSARA